MKRATSGNLHLKRDNHAEGASLRNRIAALILVALPTLGGCALTEFFGIGTRSGPYSEIAARATARTLSLDDIVVLAKQGYSAEAIIAKLRDAGGYYRLSTGEVLALRERGVPMAVIDHLLASERQFLVGGETRKTENPTAKKRETFVPTLYHGV